MDPATAAALLKIGWRAFNVAERYLAGEITKEEADAYEAEMREKLSKAVSKMETAIADRRALGK